MFSRINRQNSHHEKKQKDRQLQNKQGQNPQIPLCKPFSFSSSIPPLNFELRDCNGQRKKVNVFIISFNNFKHIQIIIHLLPPLYQTTFKSFAMFFFSIKKSSTSLSNVIKKFSLFFFTLRSACLFHPFCNMYFLRTMHLSKM